jgi:ABC-type polysaccharide/polyol phosphate transport system ATPase subunit
MQIKEHNVTITINAAVNTTNTNFPENVYAIEIVEGMIADAIAQCLEQIMDNPELKEHFNAKIKVYESIRNTLR